MLKTDVAHGLTVSVPNRDKLTMRFKSLKSLDLILSLSKDEDTFSGFFSILLVVNLSSIKPPTTVALIPAIIAAIRQ
jgi:hypothetical protein